MSNDYLVLNPTTRLDVTTIEPNNNSSPLLDNLVFRDGVTSISLSLSATDTIDLLVSSLQNIVSTTLSATDIKDTASAELDVVVSQSLNVTDSKDASGIDAVSIVSFEIDSIDSIDTSEITSTVDTSSTLEVTEKQDTALIRVSGKIIVKRTAAGNANLIPLILRLKKSNAILQASENQDGISVSLTKESNTRIRTSESSDGIKVTAQAVQIAVIAISDKGDSVQNNIPDFHKYVAEVYRRYEENQIRTLLAVA